MTATAQTPSFKRTLIQSDDELESICKRLLEHEHFASVDSETTGLDCRRSKLRLVQISGRDLNETFLIDYFKITKPQPLKEFMLSDIPKLCFKGDFDTCFFMHNFDAYIEFPIDLFLAALLLKRYHLPPGIEPDTREARNSKLVAYIKDSMVTKTGGVLKLKSLLKLYSGIDISKELQTSDWSGTLSEAQLDYAAKDTELLFQLFDPMMDEIIKEGLTDTFMIENGCQLATAMMHYYGIKIDTDELRLIGEEISTKINEAESKIGEFPEFQSSQQSLLDIMSGATTTIDLGSHPQVVKALEKRWGKEWWKQANLEKPSTQAGDLKQFYKRDPELVTLLADRTSLQSIYSNNVDGILGNKEKKKEGCIDSITQRVHSDFLQNASPQQRYSSEKPILLNVPSKIKYGPGVKDKNSPMYSERNFRDCFIPQEGCVFVKADYSSLQLVALAQESNDPTLIQIFNERRSIHAVTASAITGKPESEIVKGSSEYFTSKTVNYAVGFVCSPARLQHTFAEDDFHVSEDECKMFIKKYMEAYKGVAEYHRNQPLKVKQLGRVQVHGGRATLFGDVGTRLTDSINFAMNLYEQSGAKHAAMRIARILWKLHEKGIIARIVLMVHDEIMLEVEARYAKAVAEVLEREMVQCMQKYIYKVPIEAETKICSTWGGKPVEITESLPLPFEYK